MKLFKNGRNQAVAHPAALEAAGAVIRGNDLLIAAQAVAHGYTIVTDNERKFTRVEGLHCENWLRS